jgi:hypothetical protein
MWLLAMFLLLRRSLNAFLPSSFMRIYFVGLEKLDWKSWIGKVGLEKLDCCIAGLAGFGLGWRLS